MNNDLTAVISALPAVTYYPATPSVDKVGAGADGVSTISALSRPRYSSPNYEYDVRAQVLVVQFRDVESGRVIEQIPSAAVLEKYRLSGGSASSATQPSSDTTA